MIRKNDVISGTVSGYTAEGAGVIKEDTYPVFVPFAAEGDEGEFLVVKKGKNFGFGKIKALKKESDARTLPPCPHFGKCGGCSLMHLSLDAQLRFKTEKVKAAVRRIGGFSETLVSPCIGGEAFRYRNKAQYPVSEREGTPLCGFFAPRSHRVISIQDCLLQKKENAVISSTVTEWMNEFHIPAYREESHTGLVRHIYTRVGHATGDFQLVLVVNGSSLPHTDELLTRLQSADLGAYTLKSVVLNENTRPGNVILGKQNRVLFGSEYIEDVLLGKTYRLSPHSFYQVNPEMTERMYQKAITLAALTGKERVFDLYCGIGTIGLSLASHAKEVIGVEIVPEAIQNAEENARRNGAHNARFFRGAAEDIVPQLYQAGDIADVVVVDPPRKGCDSALLDTIGRMNPERIVYVSCDCATLARDMKTLTQFGYAPKEIQPFDQFPQTHHVESVALLTK